MTRNQHEDPLAEELARLLESDDVAAADVASADDELAEMIHLAEGLRDVPTAAPTTEFRERLRGQLLTEAATMLPIADARTEPAAPGWRERFANLRRSVSLALASALSATSIGGAGVAIASQSALPGDALYGVKQGIESARMALADGELEEGRLHLAFARERLEEVTAGAEGADRVAPDQLIDALQRMDETSTLGANELLDAYDRTGNITIMRELADFIEHQRTGLFAVMDELPVEAIPFAEGSLGVVRRIELQASRLFLQGCADCVEDLPTAPGPGDLPRTDRDPGTDQEHDSGEGGADEDGQGTADGEGGTAEGSSDGALLEEPADTLGELLDGPTLEPSMPDIEPSLPEVDPSLPTDELTEDVGGTVDGLTDQLEDTADGATEQVRDTVGDLLYE